MIATLFAVATSLPSGDLTYTAPAAPAPPDPLGLVIRLVAITVVLLGMCWGFWWFASRLNRPRFPTGNAAPDVIRREGSLSLDRRSAVHLLTVEGHSLAVTTDASGLRSIVLLSEPFADSLADETAASAGLR